MEISCPHLQQLAPSELHHTWLAENGAAHWSNRMILQDHIALGYLT
jgi:hypothetical protein